MVLKIRTWPTASKYQEKSYERKKKSGKFTAEESRVLCGLFKCGFSYLFATEDSKGDDM